MPSLIFNQKVISVGQIEETPDSWFAGGVVFPKSAFGNAFVVTEEPTSPEHVLYWDGKFSTALTSEPVEILPQVPHEITMRQARLILLRAGVLQQVQPAIDSLPSPLKEAAQIEWDYSNSLLRNNLFVQTLGESLGLSSFDIDSMFIEASKL